MEKYKHQIKEEKRAKIRAHKEQLVTRIIEDLESNLYDSQDYIWALCRESLMRRTIKDLKK